jgi:hypothetical protein
VLSSRLAVLRVPCRSKWLAALADPWVRLVDPFAGEAVGMRVDVDLEDGTTAAGIFVHKLLSDSVGCAPEDATPAALADRPLLLCAQAALGNSEVHVPIYWCRLTLMRVLCPGVKSLLWGCLLLGVLPGACQEVAGQALGLAVAVRGWSELLRSATICTAVVARCAIRPV